MPLIVCPVAVRVAKFTACECSWRYATWEPGTLPSDGIFHRRRGPRKNPIHAMRHPCHGNETYSRASLRWREVRVLCDIA